MNDQLFGALFYFILFLLALVGLAILGHCSWEWG